MLSDTGCLKDKAYSRDILMRGRIKVQLKTEDGTRKIGSALQLSTDCAVPDCPFAEQELLLAIAEHIPKLKSRTNNNSAGGGKSEKNNKKKKW